MIEAMRSLVCLLREILGLNRKRYEHELKKQWRTEEVRLVNDLVKMGIEESASRPLVRKLQTSVWIANIWAEVEAFRKWKDARLPRSSADWENYLNAQEKKKTSVVQTILRLVLWTVIGMVFLIVICAITYAVVGVKVGVNL